MNLITFGKKSNAGLWLDPRTKLVMLMVVNIVMVGGVYSGYSSIIRLMIGLLPFLLLLLEREYTQAIIYFFFIGSALASEIFLVSRTQGLINLLVVMLSGLISRFVPGLIMGYYVVSTTKIAEFIAAMERMHLSPKIIIPFSVMLRFFPTVGEEMAAINDAMRMRGIRRGGMKFGAMLEYRLVPLLMCSVKIGEELSAAALTRGLGKPLKRTNICRIGFGVIDLILLFTAIGFFLIWIIV